MINNITPNDECVILEKDSKENDINYFIKQFVTNLIDTAINEMVEKGNRNTQPLSHGESIYNLINNKTTLSSYKPSYPKVIVIDNSNEDKYHTRYKLYKTIVSNLGKNFFTSAFKY